MKVTYIDQFLFDSAIYNITDQHGTPFQLKVDYKNNKFDIAPDTTAPSQESVKEITAIAHDLLSRKHGINLAEKE